MGRDDDRVGREAPQRVLERLQRVAVADLATGPDARALEARRASPARRPAAASRAPSSSDVHVRSWELRAGQTTRTSSATPAAMPHDLLLQARRPAASRSRARGSSRCPRRRRARCARAAAAPAGLPSASTSATPVSIDEDDDAEPRRDQRRDHDQGEVRDRAEDEPERRLLVLEAGCAPSSPIDVRS